MTTSHRKSRTTIRAHDDVLGYLLKHVHATLEQRTDEALEPFELTARDLGVLRVIAAGDQTSQQDIARTLGVDATSLVAMLDALAARKIISRTPSELDRRRNLVALTQFGTQLVTQAEAAAVRAENTVTAALGPADALQLRDLLRTLLEAEASRAPDGAAQRVGRPRTPGRRSTGTST